MINVQVYRTQNGQETNLTTKVQEPITISQRLDRELDGGDFVFLEIGTETDKIVSPLTRHRVVATDGINTPMESNFIGVSQRTILRNKAPTGETDGSQPIFRHNVSLTETTKLLEGVLIEGLGVTQPNTGAQKSLHDAVTRLLYLTARANSTGAGRFSLTTDSDIVTLLQNTESPQFRWSPQSTLWECLLEVASVIDAIPYLDESEKVSFLLLNTNAIEIDDLIDEYTYSYGESVNEQQYNSKLSAIVENIKEM